MGAWTPGFLLLWRKRAWGPVAGAGNLDTWVPLPQL